MLRLTPDQKSQLDALQKDVDAKLAKILTEEQQQQLKQLRERGPAGRNGPGGFGGPAGRPDAGGARDAQDNRQRGEGPARGSERAPDNRQDR